MKKVLLALGVLALVSCSGDDDDSVKESCNCIKRTYALRLVANPITGISSPKTVLIRTEFDECGYDEERGVGFEEGSYYLMDCK